MKQEGLYFLQLKFYNNYKWNITFTNHDSLCCTPETFNIVHQLHLKFNKEKILRLYHSVYTCGMLQVLVWDLCTVVILHAPHTLLFNAASVAWLIMVKTLKELAGLFAFSYSFHCFLIFFAKPCSLQDVSSLTTDWTQPLAVKALSRRGTIKKWEGGSGWGTHVNPWLFHFNVWQNPLQYKKKKLKKWKKKRNVSKTPDWRLSSLLLIYHLMSLGFQVLLK